MTQQMATYSPEMAARLRRAVEAVIAQMEQEHEAAKRELLALRGNRSSRRAASDPSPGAGPLRGRPRVGRPSRPAGRAPDEHPRRGERRRGGWGVLKIFAPHTGRHVRPRRRKRCAAAEPEGRPGVWPGGEPESVRRAYDAMLAAQRRDDAPTTPFPRPRHHQEEEP